MPLYASYALASVLLTLALGVYTKTLISPVLARYA